MQMIKLAVSLPITETSASGISGLHESETPLKKSSFTESQIVAVLKEGETGMPVAELCRKHGINNATYYQWTSKYSGVQVSELQRLRQLEARNAKLKHVYADLDLENSAIKEVPDRKSRGRRPGARW
jgi:putative transposase